MLIRSVIPLLTLHFLGTSAALGGSDPAGDERQKPAELMAGSSEAKAVAVSDLRAIDDLSATTLVRTQAARRLVEEQSAEAHALLDEVLRRGAREDPLKPGETPDGQWLVLQRASAGTPPLPEWTIGPLVQLAQSGAVERRLLAIDALGAIGTRQSVAVLFSLAPNSQSDAVSVSIKNAIVSALGRSTAQVEPGADMARWSAWFDSVKELPEVEWQRRIAAAQARRADQASRALALANARLESVLREHFQSLQDADARSAMLATLIRDALPSLQTLGLELSLRELANARPLKDEVALAAVGVLSEPEAGLRKSAADLLAILAPASTAGPLQQALIRESDPVVASALLNACVRWPSERVREAAMRWFESGEPAGGAALGMLAAVEEAGALKDPPARKRILAALRLAGTGQLPAPGLRLLLALGDESDRDRVAHLLTWADASKKQAAADALASAPRGIGVAKLLTAARTDPTLFSQATRAVKTFAADGDGIRLLSAAAAPSNVERQRALLELTNGMEPPTLVSVAEQTSDLRLREAMLARLVSFSRSESRTKGAPSEHPQLPALDQPADAPANVGVKLESECVRGLLLLCRTRLELRQPGAALKALDAIALDGDGSADSEVPALRTTALLWVGRIDEAAAIDGGPECWLDGLENSIGQMHAMRVATLIEERFARAGRLDDSLRRRFEAAREQAAAFVGPMPEPGNR
jgi:hypothetical protein